MARPCCDPCCANPPAVLRLRAVTAGCGAIPIGFTICLTRDVTRDCDLYPCNGADGVLRWSWSGTICGLPSSTELLCCRTGCMGSCWQLGGPARTVIFADPLLGGLRDDWTCEPFFQHWDGVQWEGTAECFNGGLGVPFSVEIDELPCVEDTDGDCGSGGGSGNSGSGNSGASGA